jgi:hypothetical protein
MPYKHNKPVRHKFTKATYKVTNWPEYTESLRKRGDITIWFSDDAIREWHPEKIPGKRGRPQEYSDLAIECCLMLRQVYHLPLRQTEGFTRSLVSLMDLKITVPDYTCLSKRSISLELKRLVDSITPGSHFIVDSTGLKVYGRDEWNQEKHNVKPNRTWRKLHLGIDENHQIMDCDLTDTSVGDSSALDTLFDQIDDFEKFIADGAYDGNPIYKKILEKCPLASIIIPPPKNTVAGSSDYEQRNRHTDHIKSEGRMAWQKRMNYGLRSHIELAMLRYKTIIGPKLKARKISQQRTEAQVSVRVINRMTGLGMPISVKVA